MTHSDKDLAWLNVVRDFEFDEAIKHISNINVSDVLEIGSGTGYILTKLKKLYPKVDGLEVSGSSYSQLEPSIKIYDGVNIPMPPKSYDLIISFHVLEHATCLDELLDDCKRVLKNDGVMIHVLPSPTWRTLTTFLWFFGGLAFLIRKLSSPVVKQENRSKTIGIDWWWKRLIPRRHGEIGNALTEIFYFRKSRWLSQFDERGFHVSALESGGIVYWGNDFLRTSLSLKKRKIISKFIGASSMIYIVKKDARRIT